MNNIIYSIIVLTYNRLDRVKNHINFFKKYNKDSLELIIVDNNSDFPLENISIHDDRIKIIRNHKNLGAVGRNSGIKSAKGNIIITLDDDVFGFNEFYFTKLQMLFNNDQNLAAINFKVIEENTNTVTNWCHPRDCLIFCNVQFETNHISEGAVAFRREALEKVGYYPESFFISHEGLDLAFRLINHGYKVIYEPTIAVTHAYDQRARAHWRRYYYDTRNQLWFVVRNLSFFYGGKRLLFGWGAMLIYSIRDGYTTYWLKAVLDSLIGLPRAFREREKPLKQARLKWREIESFRPPLWATIRKRIKAARIRL